MSTTEGRVNIATLPPELLLTIANYLPFWDVYALRLTCRPLYESLPPLPKLPHNSSWNDDWMHDPLAASFLVQSNNLAVCTHCPNIVYPRADFVKWIEKGVWRDDRHAYIRENPSVPPEEWILCLECDANWQGRQNDNWCCRWKSGLEPACTYCKSQMHRIYPGTEQRTSKEAVGH